MPGESEKIDCTVRNGMGALICGGINSMVCLDQGVEIHDTNNDPDDDNYGDVVARTYTVYKCRVCNSHDFFEVYPKE